MKHAILFSFLLTGILAAEDWPQFLGPRRDGTYQGKALPKWPANGPKLLWKKNVGAGFAGPAVVNGKLYLFHRQNEKEILECMDAAKGTVIWKSIADAAYVDQFGFDNGPRAVPTVHDGSVYTLGANGVVRSTDARKGRLNWTIDCRKKFGADKGFFGFACAPLVHGKNLLLNISGKKGGIIALDTASGKLRWTATQDEASYASPIIANFNNTPQALFFTRAGLASINPADGAVNFTHPWQPAIRASVNACTPVAAGNLIFISTSYSKGATVLAVNGKKIETVWSNDTSLSCHYSSVVHHDGFLYGFHGRQERGGELRCVEMKTGKVQWNLPGLRAGSVMLAGTELLIFTERGELLRGKANPKFFRATARVQLMGATVRAYPALANGKLYLRNDRQLACFQLTE
ncbi:MAG: outer membrane protein assembly factor BamB family protein [Verrucomicrobiia bacterium]|jgi:outer membrane protein assembly factor BamB